MLISTISLEITECVNNFWKDFHHLIEANYLNIDADELMSIFIYIIIKSEINDLLIHLRMVKDFTTSSAKSTMVGYYYVTLEASIMYLLELDNINGVEDLKNKEAKNKLDERDEDNLGYNKKVNGQENGSSEKKRINNREFILDDSSLAINNMSTI